MYQRILELALSAPWAIQPDYALLVQSILAERASGHRPTADDLRARLEAAPASRRAGAQQADSIGVLSIVGVISHRMELLSQVSSTGTSPAMIAEKFRAMLADPSVAAIVLDIDSPGGSVFGLDELATEIRSARGRKPVVAVANAIAASAAYWIAAQADELVVTPTGQVGSIGVYSMHENIAEALAKEGRQVTLVSYGEFKTEGNPFEPLTEEARAATQDQVNTYGEMFVRAVAKGRTNGDRKIGVEQVRESFGRGRMVLAKDAVDRQMADRVATLEEVIVDLARQVERNRRGAEASAALADRAVRTARLRAQGAA